MKEINTMLLHIFVYALFSLQIMHAENYTTYIEPVPYKRITHEEYMAQAQQYLDEQQDTKALELYMHALEQSPFHCTALLNVAKILRSQGNYDQAFAYLSRAIDHLPKKDSDQLALGNALLNLGIHYFDARQTEKAIATFKKILLISDNLNAVHHNIAFTMSEQAGAYAQSLEHYRKALCAQPYNSETHFCYAISLLATGNLLEGFAEYEWRWKRFKHAPRNVNYPLPSLWTGTEDIQGKRIFIRVEQGIGDSLMFIRYAQLLKERGAHVIVETQKPIVQLLSLCPYLDQVIPIGSPIPPFDYQIPMLNLPLAFKTTINTIPAHIPYLYARQDLVSLWQERLATNHTFKIGICWRGDAAHPDQKFMPIQYFAQLAQHKGVTLYSLQKNEPAAEIKPAQQADGTLIQQFKEDFDNTHGRFMDTAAVMKNLNLIITVDTSIAHLAGGLGIPTWLVLPFPAEWRWLENRADSPWYPTMRLFRQKQYGNWQPVYEELLAALKEYVA